jgi:thiol:disulfide interchange protein
MEVIMDQKTFVLGILLVVCIGFGGIILYDMKANNRFGVNEPKSNWQWNDDWNQVNPQQQPQQPQQQPPVRPEVPERPMGQITATSYADALAQAGKHGMPVLINFGADWCSWCKKMKSETLTDQKVKDVMMNYVYLYVDTDKDRATGRKFGVSALPSFVITNCNEQKLKFEQGYKSAGEFEPWLNDSSMFKQPKKDDAKPERQEEPQPQPRRG